MDLTRNIAPFIGFEPNDFLKYRATGRLFAIKQDAKKCLFTLSQITFMQSPSDLYQRFIYIKNLAEGPGFNIREYYFPIKENMHMRSYTHGVGNERVIGYEWNIEDGLVMAFEFSFSTSDDLSSAISFKSYVSRLGYENKFRQSFELASKQQLEPFCRDKEENGRESNEKENMDIKPPQKYPELDGPYSIFNLPEILLRPNEDSSEQKDVNEIIKELEQQHFEKAGSIQREEAINSNVPESVNAFTNKRITMENITKEEGRVLFEVRTDLCELSEGGRMTVLLPTVSLVIIDADNFRYFFEIFNENMDILYKRLIQSDLGSHFDEEDGYFKWMEVRPNSLEISVYGCKLPEDKLSPFRLVFAQCQYEAINQEHIEDAFKKPEEQQFIRRWFDNKIEKIEKSEEPVNQDKEEMIQISGIYKSSRKRLEVQNTGQVQAKVLDRTFVSHGSVVSVYMNNDEEDTFEHILSLPTVKTLEGVDLCPKKMMMHEQDTKMLMLSSPENIKVYYMDIEKGKIVNEYEGDGINKFTDIGPILKHAEFTHNPCFIASNQKNLFLFDPRISAKNKCAAEKIYATNPKFTCITTNDTENYFATGSEKGEIRLYTKIGQNAKTLFPGLGSPIIGLDSTHDGAWLLATTKTYLMLIHTVVEGKNGYKQSISKGMEVPFKLTILPEDMKKYKLLDIDFKPAKFNDNEREGEKYILASTGRVLVIWSLKKVLSGQTEKYEIREIEDSVVSNEFRYKKEEDLLVTLPKEVRVQKAKFH